MCPPPRYFTEEVRQRLIEILKGVKEGSYTAADVKELRRTSELIEKEGWENSRRDLLDYDFKLQMLIAILEGRLIARGSGDLSGIWRTGSCRYPSWCMSRGTDCGASRRPLRGPLPPCIYTWGVKNLWRVS